MVSASTTQFMMQSYNDAIKNNAFSKIGETLSQSSKDINNLVNDYTNRQAMNERTKAQMLENQYAQDTHDERVKSVGLKNQSMEETIKGQQLENLYASDTHDERVRAVGLKNQSMEEFITGQKLGNEASRMRNEITEKTKEKHIGAVNARNVLNTASDNYLTDQTRLQHKSIQFQDVFVKDANGEFRQATPEEVANEGIRKYKNTQGHSYNQHDAMSADANNKQVALNRQAITGAAGKDFRNQEAQGNLRLQQQAMQNKSAQAREEYDNYMRSIVDKLVADGDVSEFEKFNSPILKYSDEKGQTHEILNPYHANYNNANISQPYSQQNLNVNMNANMNMFNGQQGRNAELINILNNPNATPEERQNAANQLRQTRIFIEANKNLTKMTEGSLALQKLSFLIEQTGDKNRVVEFMGAVGKIFPGTSQAEIDHVHRQYLHDEILIKGMTKSLAGSLSDRDMKLLERLIPAMFSEDSTTGQVKLLNLLHSQIAQYEAQFGNCGLTAEGWKEMNPSHYKNYMRLKHNYGFLSQELEKYKRGRVIPR